MLVQAEDPDLHVTDGLTIASLTDKIGSATGARRLIDIHSNSDAPPDAFVQHVG